MKTGRSQTIRAGTIPSRATPGGTRPPERPKYSQKSQKLLYYSTKYKVLFSKIPLNSGWREFARHSLSPCGNSRNIARKVPQRATERAALKKDETMPPAAHRASAICKYALEAIMPFCRNKRGAAARNASFNRYVLHLLLRARGGLSRLL